MTIRKYSFAALLFVAVFFFLPASAFAKDEWLQVKSKNFFLIGNASEKEIRKVATKLEQFRETFRQLFKGMNLTGSVPTNVVVFKSDSSYKPFKPKRADGKTDNFVAGYFQPGEDVNYITLSTAASDYGTIFHEYVHFVINTNFGKSEVPKWFNEGLAEYYQTFEIVEDQTVKLGIAQGSHLQLLLDNKLIPLRDFFEIGNRYRGAHSASIFYAQAWALIHYFVQKDKADGLDKFIQAAINDKPAEQAFQEAFGITYADMEKELRKYVAQRTFTYHSLKFKNKLVFDTEMTVSPISESDSNAYLGDLLFHTHRYDDAEPYLRTALTLEPDSSMANTSLGMVKIHQRKYDEAKVHLEKAVKDPKNHLALYRYAELLTREGRDEFGYVDRFEPATAARVRELLKKTVALNPSFTESYELLAFVNLVNNEQLDEAVAALQTALRYQPGNMRYAMRIAEIYLRQSKFQEAAAIAAKLAKNSDDEDIRTRAERLAADLREREETIARYEAERKKFEQSRASQGPAGSGSGLGRRSPGDDKSAEEQMAKATQAARLRSLNRSLRVLESGEKRVIGQIVKVDCKGKGVGYSVKTDTELFQLSSKDFQSLIVTTFVPEDSDGEIGCEAKLTGQTLVLSYRPTDAPKSPSRGELIAVEFVPAWFKFIDPSAQEPPPTYAVEETLPQPITSSVEVEAPVEGPATAATPKDFAEERRAAMFRSIAERLRKPGPGEKRVLGFIERSECTNKAIFFYVKSGTQVLKLSNSGSPGPTLGGYTPDVENLQFGCGMKNVDVPAVVIYKVSTETKAKVAGELISVEFVPKAFQLDQ